VLNHIQRYSTFSDRSQFERDSNPLWRLLEQFQNGGKKVLDLTESNPTRCRFCYPKSFAKSLIKKENLTYEPNAKGDLKAREEIVKYYRTIGVKLDPEQIILTSGTSEAYQFLFFLLLNPGDSLWVPAPGYPLMEPLARLNGITIDYFPLEYDGVQWKIDLNGLEERIRSRRGVVTVIHPHNPTGSYINRPDQARLIDLAKRHGLPVIADEVFFDYQYPDLRPLPRSFASQNQTLIFTLNGLSKMVALPQMKLSWIVATGPRKAVKEAILRLEQIADTYLSVNTPVQNGAGSFLKHRMDIQSQIRSRIMTNRTYLIDEVKERLPQGNVLNCEGGWVAILRLPRIMNDDEWATLLLREEGVLVYPGHLFDFPIESCLILSLLLPEPLFRRAVKKVLNRISYSLSIMP
jgi:alanine-synthesizing transaminase